MADWLRRQTHEFFVGLLLCVSGMANKQCNCTLASFGDCACAVLSNKFAELACLLEVKNC
jgi:hypothetical protein